MNRIKYCLILFIIPLFVLHADEKRALVIILSETREHELTYNNFAENVLKPLQADLAVCIGTRHNYAYDNPFFQNATYRFCYPEPGDYATAFDEAYHLIVSENPSITRPFHWHPFLKIKDQFLGGIKDRLDEHSGSGGILIFFRWFLLHNILQNDLLNKYDFFVITRSDFIFTLPHPSLSVLSEDCIYIPDGEAYGGVTDRHVILPKKFVISYLNMLNKMIINGEEYYQKMSTYDHWNLERFIKFHLEENAVWDHVRFFPYVMYTIRSKGGTTRWSAGTYSRRLGYYIKYPEEYKSALYYRSLFFKSKNNIDDFYKEMITPTQHKI